MGAGAMGSVLGKFMMDSPIKPVIIYWDPVPDKVHNQQPLDIIATRADAVFLCVPSFAVGQAARAIAPFVKKNVPIITIAKGLETPSGQTMDQVLEDSLPRAQPYGILSGPMLADELHRGQGTLAVLALSDKKYFTFFKKLFARTPLHLEFTTAVRAVAWAGVLKNIYALVLGVARGLEWGSNRQGYLVSAAIKEMVIMFEDWNLPTDIAYGTAGLGDLVATGFSSTSRNHQVGVKLAGGEVGKSEGTRSLPLIRRLTRKINSRRLPLLHTLWIVINKKQTARSAFEKLLNRV